MSNFSWKHGVIAGVLIVALVYIASSINPEIWPHKKINLGLDLQGGMHLVLEVDTQKAVEGKIERELQEMRRYLKTEGIRAREMKRVEDIRIQVEFNEETYGEKFDSMLNREFPELRIKSQSVENGNRKMILDLPDKEVARIGKLATQQGLETIRNRIDQFGVSEPDIRLQGENRILIQLPGIKETERAKALIGKTALLEFKIVEESADVAAAEKGDVPPGMQLLYQVRTDPNTNRQSRTPFLVEKYAQLTGEYLTDARVQFDNRTGKPEVSITFNRRGAEMFAEITRKNVKRRLAIVLDNKIHSAPVIQEPITGGEARISGNFTDDEAKDLAIALRAGSLPAPVHILEERTVGPSLGRDSIRAGFLSAIVGLLAVIAFMVFYYNLSGILADAALLVNMLLIGASLAAFEATLTLPGIAGIILTIGMAVDANVLIFERIREELRLGKTPRAAVDAGYDRATLTILDANITTLIAALVLFQFGTGPVKGFAVTLSIGVISSMFTALFMTRLVYDYFLGRMKVKRISI